MLLHFFPLIANSISHGSAENVACHRLQTVSPGTKEGPTEILLETLLGPKFWDCNITSVFFCDSQTFLYARCLVYDIVPKLRSN